MQVESDNLTDGLIVLPTAYPASAYATACVAEADARVMRDIRGLGTYRTA